MSAAFRGALEVMSAQSARVALMNTLLLHGAVYSPPYVVQAVGNPVGLQAQLDRDAVVTRFRTAAREYKLGFAVTVEQQLELAAYDGATAMTVAQPVRES